MARAFISAVLAALMLCLLPHAVQARSQTLGVAIFDRQAKPAVGAKVDILDMQGNKLGSGTVGANGNVAITFERPDGLDKVLIDTDAKDAEGHGTFAVVDITYAAPSMGIGMTSGVIGTSTAELVELAKQAVARCDKAAYDRWVAESNRQVADLEKSVDDAQQAAASQARENNLRITDLPGARKDLKRAGDAQAKLDPALRNPATLDALETYVEFLENVESLKRDLDKARRARESMPPFPGECKKDKVGLLPGQGTCPDGSGGLLAGALNDIFDSDLDPACDDPSRRRDTDRAKKDRHEREDRRRD
jgi:hypothetical protein